MKEAPHHLVRKQSSQSFAQSLADPLLPCGSIAYSDFSHTSGTNQFVLSPKVPTSLFQTLFRYCNSVIHRSSLISTETKTLQYPRILDTLYPPVQGK